MSSAHPPSEPLPESEPPATDPDWERWEALITSTSGDSDTSGSTSGDPDK
jgi:hypothetical protein